MNKTQIIKEFERVIDNGANTLDSPFLDTPLYIEYIKEAITIIKGYDEQIFKLENRLKECENGYQGTLFMESCKLHDAEEKIEVQANVIKDLTMRIQKASELLEPLKTRIFEQHNETIDEVVERVKGLFAPDDEVIKEIDEISQELKIQC